MCCAGKMCCGACCSGFKACGVPAKNFPKISYVITSVILMLCSVLLMFSLRYLTEKWDWLNCAELAGGGSLCFGISSAFRASFTLFLYHCIMLLVICPRAGCSSGLHDGFWCIKGLILVVLFIISFQIPYEFYDTWGWISLCISSIFLFIQAYFLLNLAYTWGDQLTGFIGQRDGGTYAYFLLLTYSILNSVGCVIWLVYQYIWFAHCAIGVFTLLITTLFAIFFWAAALVRLCNIEVFRENANIFVASLAVTYITYLCWSALASNPDEECNPFLKSGPNTTWQLIAGTTFTTLTILSIATASKSVNDDSKSLGNVIIAEDAEGDAKPEDAEKEEAAIFPVTIPTMVF